MEGQLEFMHRIICGIQYLVVQIHANISQICHYGMPIMIKKKILMIGLQIDLVDGTPQV